MALAESKVDPTAQKTMMRLVEYFGLALSVIINILDPDVIVIGGGVGGQIETRIGQCGGVEDRAGGADPGAVPSRRA